MIPSGRRTIVCILLLLLSSIVSAQSESNLDKTATSTVSGKVTIGGKGLQGVVVGLVITDQYRSKFQPTSFRSTTDEDGNYRIKNVPSGNYEVIVASPAYVAIEGRKSVLVGKNETVESIDISIARGGVITGKVTDADGNPLIEEPVYLSAVKTEQRAYYFRNIRTDDRGIYRAYGIPAGRYTVAAGADSLSNVGNRRSDVGYRRTYHPNAVDPAAATVIDVRDGSEATNVDITLRGPARTYTARGRIIDSETDKPVPNMRLGVQTSIQYGTASLGNVGSSNNIGEFKVEKLAPGKYSVYSEPPDDADWHSESVPFEITDRDVEGLVIKTFKGATISGVVDLEGTADPSLRAKLVGGQVIARVIDGIFLGRLDRSATINPNGSFRINGLAPGRLSLQLGARDAFRVIRVERGGVTYTTLLEIKENEQLSGVRVVAGYADGTIRGVIRLSTGAELPADARFRAHFRRTDDLPEGGMPVEVDTRGQFRIEKLVPGTYEVVVNVDTKAAPTQTPRIPPARQLVSVTNGAVADVTITLQIPKPSPQ